MKFIIRHHHYKPWAQRPLESDASLIPFSSVLCTIAQFL